MYQYNYQFLLLIAKYCFCDRLMSVTVMYQYNYQLLLLIACVFCCVLLVDDSIVR